MILDKGQDSLSEGLGSRGFIGRNGSGANEDFVFRDETDGRRRAGDGEGRGMRRMTMDDGACTRVGLVDFEVHEEFAGPRSVAGQHVAIEVAETDVGRLDVPLADQGRSAKHRVRTEAHADVAAVAVDVAALPELSADGDDFGAKEIGFRRKGCR